MKTTELYKLNQGKQTNYFSKVLQKIVLTKLNAHTKMDRIL